MSDREILIDLAVKLIPIVRQDMIEEAGKQVEFRDVVSEAVQYARDILTDVDDPESDDDGPDDGETVVDVLPAPVRMRRRA